MWDHWYKEAIIYCLDVDTFMDSNGDGIGDFKGLMRRLDYIAGLGATCLWLLPFYPSPNRDNGYDVMDFYSVDGNLGTLGDFVEFMHRARAHGLRVIVDLVVNHTSDQHVWFQAARTDPHSPYVITICGRRRSHRMHGKGSSSLVYKRPPGRMIMPLAHTTTTASTPTSRI